MRRWQLALLGLLLFAPAGASVETNAPLGLSALFVARDRDGLSPEVEFSSVSEAAAREDGSRWLQFHMVSEEQFDRAGNDVQGWWPLLAQPPVRLKNTYDGDGMLVAQDVFDMQGTLQDHRIGTVTPDTYTWISNGGYERDVYRMSGRQLTRHEHYRGRALTRLALYQDGHPVREEAYGQGGVLQALTVFSFKGPVVTEQDLMQTPAVVQATQYNDRHLPIHRVVLHKDTGGQSEELYRYTFDQYGNWVLRQVLQVGAVGRRSARITARRLKYFGGREGPAPTIPNPDQELPG